MSEETKYAPPVELYKALRAARTDMIDVGKSGRNEFDRYDYSSLHDYIKATDDALAKHGLIMIVSKVTPEWSTSFSPKMPARVVVHIDASIVHCDSGQSIELEGWGEAFDKGDKALYKAITGARKYVIACGFNIYTGDDPETESVPEPEARNPYREQQRQREPERPADPPQENPVEKAINARPTAAELASYLLTLTGKHPVKENAQRWKEIGVAVKKRLAAVDWDDAQKAIVEAVLDGVRAQLKPAGQPESNAVADTATKPAAEAKGDPSKAPSFERLAGWVDQMESPAALADVVTSLESSAKFIDLRANPVAMAKAVVYALDKLNRHTDDQSWPFDECSKAGQVIIAIRDKYALDADSIETFGGGPETATPEAAAAG